MALAYRASTTVASDVGTSITISKPTGTADDDLLWAVIATSNKTDTITGPTGWALEQTVDHPSETRRMSIWTKRASSEPANWTWSWASNITRFGGVSAYSGGIASGAYVDVNGSGNTGSDASPVGLSITTTVADTMIVFGGVSANTAPATWTPPGGMDERFEVHRAMSSDVLQAGAGASGNKTATLTSGADSWMTHLLAFKPAVAGRTPKNTRSHPLGVGIGQARGMGGRTK